MKFFYQKRAESHGKPGDHSDQKSMKNQKGVVSHRGAFEFQSKNFYQRTDRETAETLEILKAKIKEIKENQNGFAREMTADISMSADIAP